MQQVNYRYLYGPVPSRRLGLSLGVDLLNGKTCSYDCLFCQVGRTVHHTVERRAYVPAAEVLKEADAWLASGGKAETIALSGSGEPTLHTGFGEILGEIRRRTPVKTALLSNGSLFGSEDVRAAAARAAVVKVSLSAWDQRSLEEANRPCPGLRLDSIVEGYRRFRAEFRGILWIEVVALRGLNDTVEAMRRIAEIVAGIRPDRVHLNTVARPPAYPGAQAVSRETMEELAALFDPRAEVMAEREIGAGGCDAPARDIVAILSRRPCTAEDLAACMGRDRAWVEKELRRLAGAGRVRVEEGGGGRHYRAV